MGNAASERARKIKLLDEFKAIVELDAKLPRNQFHKPRKADRPEEPGWPDKGGPKLRHFYIERSDGTDHLVSMPNEPYTNIDSTAGGRPYNAYLRKGYKEVWGEELLAVVEKQQASCRARLDEAVEAEQLAAQVPIAAVDVSRGRRRSVKAHA